MPQICYDCDKVLPKAVAEGTRYTCTCGAAYRLTAEVIYLGEPITREDCRIRRFYKVLCWAPVGDL